QQRANSSPGLVSGRGQDTITYSNALPNLDVRYQVFAEAVKEALVLRARPARSGSPEFAFPVQMQGLSARTSDDGAVQFVDRADKVVFAIPSGVAIDSSGIPGKGLEGASAPVSVRLLGSGDSSVATVVVSVDAAWLADPARVFPVTIDP